MNTAALLLTALLAIYTHIPQPMLGRIVAGQTRIAAHAADAERIYGVPAGLMLATGFCETHLGTANNEGGNWGAPIDPQHRHTAGTPMHAARAMARSYEVCGTWEGAVGRFRSGLCRPHVLGHQRYVRTVLGLARRMYTQAGQPVPAGLMPAAQATARRAAR